MYIWRRSRRFRFFFVWFRCKFGVSGRFLVFLCPGPFSDKEVQGKNFLQIPLWLRNKDTYPAGATSLLTDPGCGCWRPKTTTAVFASCGRLPTRFGAATHLGCRAHGDLKKIFRVLRFRELAGWGNSASEPRH